MEHGFIFFKYDTEAGISVNPIRLLFDDSIGKVSLPTNYILVIMFIVIKK